jgi:carboxyl-terminal processing protease
MKMRFDVACVSVVAGCALLGGVVGRGTAADARAAEMGDRLRNYTAALAAIEEDYVDEVKPEHLVSTSIREMLRGLDPHSTFLETRDYGQLQERQKGSYYGLGLSVYSVDGNITVSSVFEGTPAHRLGIRAGDVIARIEEQEARGLSIDDVVKRLKGPKGTSVNVTITRAGYDVPLHFTVVRDAIRLHAVPYSYMLTPTTGYLRLSDFNELAACPASAAADCHSELAEGVTRLRRSGARALVLDIRDNPGGLLDQAIAVSNLFFNKGRLVVFTRGRTRRDEASFVTEQNGPFADLPLVVLVSKHSASASEIVAGALQDHDRGILVGEVTFGKGLVQTVIPLRSVRGYALSLTTARYYTPSGRLIQRDYRSTAIEDYVSRRDRGGCDEPGREPRLTDAGRTVYAGNGITPDYCVAPPAPSKFVGRLLARNAFADYARGYAASTGGAELAGVGSRSEAAPPQKVRVIGPDFDVDDAVLSDFREFLAGREIRYTAQEFDSDREALRQRVLEEILLQVFGESAARKRSLQWDPQVQQALRVVPMAELLLSDPKAFATRQAAAAAAHGQQTP